MGNAVLDELSGLQTLNALLRWVAGRPDGTAILDVIALDEYTHDLILRLDGDLFAVFDTT